MLTIRHQYEQEIVHYTKTIILLISGVYGDVIRVKILYNKKDNALIQYSEPQQAQLGE